MPEEVPSYAIQMAQRMFDMFRDKECIDGKCPFYGLTCGAKPRNIAQCLEDSGKEKEYIGKVMLEKVSLHR